jgi:hypothetical protein
MKAFYEQLDEGRFRSTEHTVGPWSAEMQHMGPPSALLTRELERCAPRDDVALSRITVEVLGPVPPVDVEVSTEVVRPGRTIELLGAEMVAGGRPVARAWGWRIGIGDTTEQEGGAGPALPGPEHGRIRESPEGWVPGYLDALEWRWLRGHLSEPGPGTAWARLLVEVVGGEDPSALQRLMAAADSANGIASRLDAREWLFLNTDLTVHLHRAPKGEWTGVDAETVLGPAGAGVCSGVLHDEQGPVGRSAQILTVRRR